MLPSTVQLGVSALPFAEIVRYLEPPADQLAEWNAADAASRDRALITWPGQ